LRVEAWWRLEAMIAERLGLWQWWKRGSVRLVDSRRAGVNADKGSWGGFCGKRYFSRLATAHCMMATVFSSICTLSLN
jgi:hypothetical protein